MEPMTPADEAAVIEQINRIPRGVAGVAARCASGHPAVLVTAPRLPDGTPFPTLYYLTCNKLASAIGRLEASGLMAKMQERLAENPELAEQYRRAHESYLADRAVIANEMGIDEVPEISGFSAGGMPTRVKCLHALVAHSLAVGPGVNPFGDEALALLGSTDCEKV